MRNLARAAVFAAVVIAYALLRDGLPDSAGAIVLTVVALALAAAPPIVLLLFYVALRELAELPQRLRDLPDTAAVNAAGARRLVEEARGTAWYRLPRVLLAAVSLVRSSRESLMPWAGVLPLLSLPFLGVVALATVAAVIEIVAALVILIALVL